MSIIELSFFRCTRFRFGPLQENQIIPRLEHVATAENVEVTEDGKKALIALSGGDMRKVHNLIWPKAIIIRKCDFVFYITISSQLFQIQ